MQRLLLACALIVALAGCGNTERNGKVGDRLEARDVVAAVTEFDDTAPVKKSVTGFGVPTAGNRLVGAHVALCSETGQAIGTFNFALEYDGGEAKPRQPQGSYKDAFGSVRDACEDGWLVFDVPEDAKAEAVTFTFDDTGNGGKYSGRSANHLRYRWTV